MFDLLLWILPHFVTHYADQTNQGNTNDGDGVDVNQASGSKDAASLIQGTTSTTLPTTLRESNTPNQSGALHLRIANQKRIAKVDTGYENYSSHAHSNNHNQDHSHPLRMILHNPMKCHSLFIWESQRQSLTV
ncbi:hypothetical protein BASA62_000015 [Batrachochytrium salamandrivorans]|nr:hypothetical protein BASA62_000015 [Batrachochytrium salamandrivorans]